MTNSLPIDEILSQISTTLIHHNTLVIQAPPGAGKTTQVPLALLDAPWLGHRNIIMLEPRRVAVRSAARYMASRLGQAVGERVGYQIRMERKISKATRIEVVTEGILTARLQSDPSLETVGAVIFDEFHERNLNSDLGLALCLEIQEALREDLKIVVMSATLDSQSVSTMMDNASILISRGKSWPVKTHYVDPTQFLSKARGNFTGGVKYRQHQETTALEKACAAALRQALTREQGDILVFLPGMREIRNMEKRIKTDLSDILTPAMEVLPLHGSLPPQAQDRAILKHPMGHRKIVLATAIAETSITMEGVTIVIDMGLMRISRFYPGRGMDRLETVVAPISSVDQRRGRAGRTAPGVCFRLWSRANHALRPPFPAPEITQTDLADTVLQLGLWGVKKPSQLKWLDLPPESTFSQARDLLIELGALDENHGITQHGKNLARLGIHPRLGHMICRAKAMGDALTACYMAALLQERDIISFKHGPRDVDITLRLELVYARAKHGNVQCGGRNNMSNHSGGDRHHSHGIGKDNKNPPAWEKNNGIIINGKAVDQVIRTARHLARKIKFSDNQDTKKPFLNFKRAGSLLSFAFPERIAMARPGQRGFFLMASGAGVRVHREAPLAGAPFIVAAQLDGQGNNALVFLGAPHDAACVKRDFKDKIIEQEIVTWDDTTKSVRARKEKKYGALQLSSSVLKKVDEHKTAMAMLEGIRCQGLSILPWTKQLKTWQARVCFLVSTGGYPDFPALDDAFLLQNLESWLLPFLSGISSAGALKRLNLAAALKSPFTWAQQQQIHKDAPTHIVVPSGSRIPLVYADPCISPANIDMPLRLPEKDQHSQSPHHKKQETLRKKEKLPGPVLPVRLQEMFGSLDTPTVARGSVPVTLHLLSPAGRPVQITRDLKSFWENTYIDVKKDLKGRYPRHYWPDNPLEAQATGRAKSKNPKEAR
ncbi:ATP-dependent helicase HrpB [Desulfocicer vacuolatum DSM 3385]|uniref:ATP-dependent helicase HrpB n=1 Tax=Desulfocicer vacuolatum DSM 3385 TaxID=1121400 RepID=A0A1W2AGC7_9BACT|nr:ATP-dependent helicase HrpB [Desulfocicer vacuolatum]SMC59552.1 ATP-dependent helicase HrpB [Desulfocicer vacuolatum DSM 3385]